MKKILTIAILLGASFLFSFQNIVAQVPVNPQPIPDSAPQQALVVYASGQIGELDRIAEIYNKTRHCNIPLIIITTKGQSTKAPIPNLQKKPNVKVIVVNNSDAYGGGFARDNLPIVVQTANGCKYLWGNPSFGKEMLEELKKAKDQTGKPVLDGTKVVQTPFQFDGGDMTIGEIEGKKYLFVTENFCQRNTPKGQKPDFAALSKKLKDYLGVHEVVKLQTPPSMGSHDSHSDFFVRPLPPCGENKGKLVVSSSDTKTSKEDKAALDKNVSDLQKRVGAGNVVTIPVGEGNPKYSYANAVVVRTPRCCLILVPQFFGGGQAESVKAANDYLKDNKLNPNAAPSTLLDQINALILKNDSEPDFDPRIVYDLYALKQYQLAMEKCCQVIPISSYDTFRSGGATHCRVGNLFIGPCVKPNANNNNNNNEHPKRRSRGRGRH